MKAKHLLLFLFVSVLLLGYAPTLSGATYYVSTSGNDSNNGTSTSTPWKTIAKVNSFSFAAGDNIYFNKGNTWNEALTPLSSGTSSNRITFGAYGTGANPIISGFTTVTGWTNYGSHIFSKTVSTAVTPRMVTVDGVNQPIGRYPKTGYWNIDGHSGTTQITANELTTNYNGGNVVVREYMGLMATGLITGYAGTTITFSGVDYVQNNYGFFVNNDLDILTSAKGAILGDWAYLGGTLYMYFPSDNPDSYTVKIAANEHMVNLSGKSYVTLDGLTIEGGNNGVYASTASNTIIQNCEIRFMGDHGIKFFCPNCGGGTANTINNNTITDCNNMGIETASWLEFSNATVTNNILTNIGSIAGMGGNNWQAYSGIRAQSNNSLVQYNKVTNVGYVGIGFYGSNCQIKNNYINTFCTVKNDGGGIYHVVSTLGQEVSGCVINDNIVVNGIGLIAGQVDPEYKAIGIYLDDKAAHITISGNTVWNTSGSGIFLHNSWDVDVINNTVGKAGYDQSGYEGVLKIERGNSGEPQTTDIVNTGNQYISFANPSDPNNDNGGRTIQMVTVGGTGDVAAAFTTADNNYYAMPLVSGSPTELMRVWPYTYGGASTPLSLAEWKTMTGKEANSNISQVTITNTDQASIYYNETKVNKIVTLPAACKDVAGTPYAAGNITLTPYTSLILFSDGTQVATPTFSPVAGTYTSTQSVTISTATSGATIRYTTEGSTPTGSSTLYTSPVSVSATTTLKAIGIKSGLSDSDVGTAVYTINIAGATEVNDMVTGTGQNQFEYVGAGWLINTSNPGAYMNDCHFTLTTNDYYNVDFTGTQIAVYSEKGTASGIAAHSIDGGAETNVDYYSSTTLKNTLVYTSPTLTNASHTLKVRVTGTKNASSSGYYLIADRVVITSGTQVATPTFSPVAGTYTSTQSVTISTTTSGAEIRYTTDGSTPTGSSTLYSSPVSVAATITLKAIGIKSGMTTSAVGTAVYTIQVATPTFSPVAGTYTSTQSVTISTATSGATIRYTTEGSTPTGSSTLYTSPVSVSATTTLKAIGIKSGLSDSDVGTAVYTINIAGAIEVNDMVTGTGQNQFEYVGAGWLINTSNPGAYMNDCHFTATTNDYYNVDFTGSQIAVYSEKGSDSGITAYSIDGGAETNVDQYNSTELENMLVYTSPTLTNASHTLKVRVTGTKNASSSGYYHVADRVVITSDTQVATGINDLHNTNECIIYPNPSNGRFSIKSSNTIKSVEIYTVSGGKIYSRNNINQDRIEEMNIQSIHNGIYFIRLFDGEKYSTKKLIIRKD